MKKKILKISVWVIGVLVFVASILIYVGNNMEDIIRKIETWKSERYDQALQKQYDKLKVLYTADKDGGSTPEETIDLFIEALKAGDIEKASKYYVLEKQKEELEHLRKKNVEDKNLDKTIKTLLLIKNDGIKSCGKNYDYGGVEGCTFEYSVIATEVSTSTAVISGQMIEFVTPVGSEEQISFSMIKNTYSMVWKIVY